jgi:Fe-S oxidoreductase
MDEMARPANFFNRTEEDKYTFNGTPPVQQRATFLQKFVAVFRGFGYSEAEATQIALEWLPNILRYDYTSAAGYPNGRKLADDIVDSGLSLFARLRDEKGMKTVVTSCAGCFRAIKKDYSLADRYGEIMDGIWVVHTVDYLYELYQQGRLPLAAGESRVVTYHDPCHTGRHLNKFQIDEDGSVQYEGAYLGLSEDECVYEAPRELLRAIPGVELREMPRNRANSFCCGGGGGVMTGFPDWASRNASRRIEEGEATGAEEMVSICPFCFFNLGEGARVGESHLKVRDLTELIDEALPESI